MPAEPNIVLASMSKRRHEIIGALDAAVEIIPSGTDEREPRPAERAEDYVVSVAAVKARDASKRAPAGSLVIGADTSVVLEGRVLGKPVDDAEARAMLTALRGRSHRVVTGVTVARSGAESRAVESSEVVMRAYSDDEMESYIASGEPFDKAGGYAIQDTEFAPVSGLTGCYLNVVGFPLCEVIRLMSELEADAGLRPGWRAPERCPSDCPVRVVGEVAVA